MSWVKIDIQNNAPCLVTVQGILTTHSYEWPPLNGIPAPSQSPPVAPPRVPPTSSRCQSLVPTPTPPCFMSRIMQYGEVCVWLPILSMAHVTLSTWAGVSVPPVHEWDLLRLVFDSLFTVENTQVVFRISKLWRTMPQTCTYWFLCEHTFSFLWSKYLWVLLLATMTGVSRNL